MPRSASSTRATSSPPTSSWPCARSPVWRPGREIDELEEIARDLGTSPGIRQTPSRVERVTAPSLGAGVRHRAIRTVDGGVEADALLEMFDDIVGTIRVTLVEA